MKCQRTLFHVVVVVAVDDEATLTDTLNSNYNDDDECQSKLCKFNKLNLAMQYFTNTY